MSTNQNTNDQNWKGHNELKGKGLEKGGVSIWCGIRWVGERWKKRSWHVAPWSRRGPWPEWGGRGGYVLLTCYPFPSRLPMEVTGVRRRLFCFLYLPSSVPSRGRHCESTVIGVPSFYPLGNSCLYSLDAVHTSQTCAALRSHCSSMYALTYPIYPVKFL